MKTKLFFCLFVVSFFLAASVPADAEYPTKPVTLIAWASPGSSSDICARTLAKVSQEFMGQPIAVINKRGGGGLVAMKYLLSKPADGYTILLNTKSIVATLNRKGMTVHPKDFDYICGVQYDPNLLSLGPASPVKDFKGFIDYAKKNPGELRVSGYRAGAYHHSVMFRIEKAAGIKVKWVPYPGSGDATVAAIGGHVHATLSNPTSQLGGIESGKLIPIVATGGKRLAKFPAVPTLKEAGVDLEEFQFRGVVAKKGTPSEIISKLMDAIKKGTETDEWQAFIKKVQQPYFYMPGPEYRELVMKEFSEYKPVIAEMMKFEK
ncbi:MAG: tripartite tricarboxylate transporter substrate binding protein [Patescibacteria group bacterium]